MKKLIKLQPRGVVTLRAVAQHIGLTASTVSAVLNDAPAARVIPQRTKDRVLAAARELNYRPNFFARTLRKKRTYTIGVIAEEIGDAYGAMVISGIEAYLRQKDYFFFTVVHRHDLQVLEHYTSMLIARGVEGFITVDTSLQSPPILPTVAVAGHRRMKGVTNIVLDHHMAGQLVITHLLELGHREIAFIRGQTLSSDSSHRWTSSREVARKRGLSIRSDLIIQLDSDEPAPEVGYRVTKQLLSREKHFTALFAYNDIAAIGAIRAIREAGLNVPEDISVIGFDDIREAAYQSPSLSTVRQPLREMGEIAARTLVDRIEGRKNSILEIALKPTLIARESTAKAPVRSQRRRGYVNAGRPLTSESQP
jgi:LacI family transcriptional regulator